MKDSLKIRYLLAGFLLINLLFFLGGCNLLELAEDPIYNDPNWRVIKESVENECNLIIPMPEATEITRNVMGKKDMYSISMGYKVDCNYEEVSNYYDKELKKNDWSFIKEEKLTDWGRDFGGKTVKYIKGEMRVAIQFAGEKANYGWDYAVSISLNPEHR